MLTFPAAGLVPTAATTLPLARGPGAPPPALLCPFPGACWCEELWGAGQAAPASEPVGSLFLRLPSYKEECSGLALPHCPGQEDPREPPDSAGHGPWPDWAQRPLPAPTTHVTGHCQPCPCRMPPPPSGGGDVASVTWPGA